MDDERPHIYRDWPMWAIAALCWLGIWLPVAAALHMR